MKNKSILYLFFLLSICSIFKIISLLETETHPTLNEEAMEPDLLLKNASLYTREHLPDRSLFHLSRAIDAMRKIENDVDISTGEALEKAVEHLEVIRGEIIRDSLDRDEMVFTFAEALNALSFAELRISESYAETNKIDKAKVALRYAKFHIKNSMQYSAGPLRDQELTIYYEMDSLLHDNTLSAIAVMMKLDHMIHELETLIEVSPEDKL